MKIASNSPLLYAAVFLGLALVTAPAAVEAQISLATVVDLAQRNSNAVKLADADVRKAQATLAESKDVYIPNLTVGSGLPAFPTVGFTGGVPSIASASVQSLVFSIPQRHYLNAARAGLKAASLSLNEAREQAALDASMAYLELDTVNRELDASHEQEDFANRLMKIEQDRTEAGVDPLADLLQSQLTAAQLKLRRLHLETRASTLSKQLAVLTALPTGSISPDHSSIPEIPTIHADSQRKTAGIQSAQMLAGSKRQAAEGDLRYEFLPLISFNALYSRSTKVLNDANFYYAHPIPTTNFASGFSIQIPIFDIGHRAKAKESAADALRATVEAEQFQHQNDIQIVELNGNLRELDALAEIASLKRQIAGDQLKTVLAELETGNGAGGRAGGPAKLSPKAEQLARIDERQKFTEAQDAGLDLAKARLNLLRALGHMEDWLNELHTK